MRPATRTAWFHLSGESSGYEPDTELCSCAFRCLFVLDLFTPSPHLKRASDLGVCRVF